MTQGRNSWRRYLHFGEVLGFVRPAEVAPGKVPMLEKPLETVKLEPRHFRVDPSRLGPSLQVKGEISGSEDLLIDGLFEGAVQLDVGKLTIGPRAKVTADLIASEVLVSGHVTGNVRAKCRIEIKKDGSVTGDLTTPQILIEDGACFKGSIQVETSARNEIDEESPSPVEPLRKSAAHG